MTNLQTSSSKPSNVSLLDPRIQQWIWKANWTSLRDAQEQAIPLILDGSSDVIIAASTSQGKTEAAFFPILTKLAQNADEFGIVLYVSPLKALINDQMRRLTELAEPLDISITPWHGDVNQTLKSRFLKKPDGCLLITPESLEAMLMRRGHGLGGMLAALRYIVVDELHAFMGTERGKQLQSLLHRVEQAVGRRVCRIALSATLGNMDGAKDFLRPDGSCQVELVNSAGANQTLKVLVKGVLDSAKEKHNKDELAGPARLSIAESLYKELRGTSNLVFPNSRTDVEFYADFLRQSCENNGVPNEFWPHHGNLSREIREETEAALKKTDRPATAICTTTLELGIDIGPVKRVVQVGSPPSVASLRQRLGRSGRRPGEPMILSSYCIENELTAKSGLSEMLREGLVTVTAMVRLLILRWYEPVSTSKIHGSTLVQQVLAFLVQNGGAYAQSLWDTLCGSSGPFKTGTPQQFTSLLRKLHEQEIIFQDPSGLIMLAPKGEQITSHFSFYAAFSSSDEFRIVTAGRSLGSMPLNRPLTPGSFLIFAGRRWEVMKVNQDDKTIEVKPASGGTVPPFDGSMGAMVHDRVREEMRLILGSTDAIPFLDPTAQKLLNEARANYARLGLDHTWLLQMGADVEIILWRGDAVNDTLLLMLLARGLRSMNDGVAICVKDASVDNVREVLEAFRAEGAVDPLALASTVLNKVREKWDHLLPEDLLNASFASANLDTIGVQEALKKHLEMA